MKCIKKCLVTGGSGFIGSHLCEELLERGFKVAAVDNFATSSLSNIKYLLKNKNFRFFKGSVLDKKLVARLVKDCGVVYHMAAAVGVKYIIEHGLSSIMTNLNGTENVLAMADKYKKKVVIASTSEVYGKHVCRPFSENDDRILGSTTVGRWSYAGAKAMDEFLALAYYKEKNVPVVIARIFNTVGPRQSGSYGMVLPRLIKQALTNKPLTIYDTGDQIRTFTYVKDTVRAITDLSFKKEAVGQVFNVGNDEVITIKELAAKIIRFSGSNSKLRFISYQQAFGKGFPDFEDIECRIPDISKLRKTVGYEPEYDVDTIIKNTISYMVKNES